MRTHVPGPGPVPSTASGSGPRLLYDGRCGPCRALAAFLAARGAPVQPSDDVDPSAFGLADGDLDAAAWWAAPGATSRADRGSDAIGQALRATDVHVLQLVGFLVCGPLAPLARTAYPVLARHRHRLPGSRRRIRCAR